MTSPVITCLSYAKLNLALHVFPSIPPSYLHPISSIFQQISLADTITYTIKPSKTPTLTLTCAGLGMPTNSENILHSIFNYVKLSCTHDYNIHINKNIPMGSGMGGSSSNAANFMALLNHIEAWNLNEDTLIRNSKQFGSDIAFFFRGGTQLVTGIGDQLQPYPTAKQGHYIIIYPNSHSSTGKIYQTFDSLLPTTKLSKKPVLVHGHNNLMESVFTCYPKLRQTHKKLSFEVTEPVWLTGSGSTFFIQCNKNAVANTIVDHLRSTFPDFYIQAVHNVAFPVLSELL